MQKRSNFADMIEIKREITIPGNSFFLFGPRGTGKSTFIKGLITKQTLFIDFLDPDTFRNHAAFPEIIIKTVNATNPDKVIIDEIQKVPQILDVVHIIMEERRMPFILT